MLEFCEVDEEGKNRSELTESLRESEFALDRSLRLVEVVDRRQKKAGNYGTYEVCAEGSSEDWQKLQLVICDVGSVTEVCCSEFGLVSLR